MRVLLVGTFRSDVIGTRTAAEELGEQLKRWDVKVIPTSRYGSAIPKLLDMLRTTVLRRGEYDVASIDVYSGRAFVWAATVARTLGAIRRPYVLNLAGGLLPEFTRRHPVLVRGLIERAPVVLAPSRYIADMVDSVRPDVRVVPNGIVLERYPHRERPHCLPKLVWLRAIHDVYDPLTAALAVARVRRRFPDVELTMIGPDKCDGTLERLRSLIAEEGLGPHVRIIGPVPKGEVPRHLAAADVFLNTTRSESLGVSVIEAMACGLCVVSTNVGALPEVVNEAGLLVPPGDPEAMAAAIERVLDDHGLSSRLSAAARRRSEQYDWDSLIGSWIEAYEMAVSGI